MINRERKEANNSVEHPKSSAQSNETAPEIPAVIRDTELGSELDIPALKSYGPAPNQAMQDVEDLIKIAHDIAVMVHEENLQPVSRQADLIRHNQPEKEKLCNAYVAGMETLAAHIPSVEERDEERITDLKKMAQVMQSILDTHLYMTQVAISATDQIIKGIRKEVATKDGQNLVYNAQGTSGHGRSAQKQRTSSVAVHKVI